ncbi:N-alpha-acetyltransferase 20 [Rhodotorula sphaerocarpa]
MSLLRPFSALDLFEFNAINLDVWTETYGVGYYLSYLMQFGDLFSGHVSAITVSPQHRRLGLASMMMDLLEKVSERDDAWFVDLFVRQSNDLAIGLYKSLGYVIYRRVQGYYGGGPGEDDEDAYDMRKSLPIDKEQESVRLPAGYSDGRDVLCQPEDIVF